MPGLRRQGQPEAKDVSLLARVQVILAVTALSPQARYALQGRIDVFIELDRSTAPDMAAG